MNLRAWYWRCSLSHTLGVFPIFLRKCLSKVRLQTSHCLAKLIADQLAFCASDRQSWISSNIVFKWLSQIDDRIAIARNSSSTMSLFSQPRFRDLACFLKAVPLQGTNRYIALFSQGWNRPVNFLRQFLPVLDVIEFGIHVCSFKEMSILQCGQAILSPMAWAGNSICPLQKKQVIFNRSGLRRVMTVWQCGQGIVRPNRSVVNWILVPQWGQASFIWSMSEFKAIWSGCLRNKTRPTRLPIKR